MPNGVSSCLSARVSSPLRRNRAPAVVGVPPSSAFRGPRKGAGLNSQSLACSALAITVALDYYGKTLAHRYSRWYVPSGQPRTGATAHRSRRQPSYVALLPRRAYERSFSRRVGHGSDRLVVSADYCRGYRSVRNVAHSHHRRLSHDPERSVPSRHRH